MFSVPLWLWKTREKQSMGEKCGASHCSRWQAIIHRKKPNTSSFSRVPGEKPQGAGMREEQRALSPDNLARFYVLRLGRGGTDLGFLPFSCVP